MDSYKERIKEIDRILSEEELPSLDRAFLEYLRFANESIGWSKEICRNIDKVVEEMSKLPIKENDMEEKKTKKMTKAEAFEYLKGKKVYCYDGANNLYCKLVKKMWDCGCTYKGFMCPPNYSVSALAIDRNGVIGHVPTEVFERYINLPMEEISADDILSIEIVEEENEPLDKWDDFARCVAKVQEKIEEDEVCIIMKGNFLTMAK